MKLPHTIGLESTFLPPMQFHKLSEGRVCDLSTTYASIAEELLLLNKVEVYDCSEDCGAIEISSPILKTYGQVKKFYDGVNKLVVEDLRCVPTSPVSMGGGQHIHVGISGYTNDEKRIRIALLRDIINRPYLNWVFNDPYDEGTADWMMKDYNIRGMSKNLKRKIPLNPTYYHDFSSPNNPSYMRVVHLVLNNNLISYNEIPDAYLSRFETCNFSRKDKALSYRNNTVEFRFFDMVNSWEEQCLHINFVFKYLDYIKKNIKRDYVSVVDLYARNKFRETGVKNTWMKFSEFIEEIGMDPKPFKELYYNNLKQRFSINNLK